MTASTTPSMPATMPFSSAQRAMLVVLMDQLIPASPDGRMPAASTLGLFDSPAPMTPRDRHLFDTGLADLDARARREHGQGLASLAPQAAAALVASLRAKGSPFLQAFATQTVGRYVSHPTVMPLIGLPPRPLWPEGNAVAPGDWSLLEVVKRRGKIYRVV